MQRKVICLTLLAIVNGPLRADDTTWTAERISTYATTFAIDTLRREMPDRLRDSIEFQATAVGVDERLHLPDCAHPPQTTLTVANAESGRVLVAINCLGPVVWSVPMTVNVTFQAEVLVAARALHMAETIDATATVGERRHVTGLPATVVLLKDPLPSSMMTRRAIPASAILRRSDLAVAPVIRRGDSVTLIARAAGVEVRTDTVALGEARRGDTIRLRNISSGKVLQGRAQEAGQAVAVIAVD